jgi:hypothetical protein
MQITLRQRLEQFSHLNQSQLFGFLEQQAATLTDKTRLLVSTLGLLRSAVCSLPPAAGKDALAKTARPSPPPF